MKMPGDVHSTDFTLGLIAAAISICSLCSHTGNWPTGRGRSDTLVGSLKPRGKVEAC